MDKEETRFIVVALVGLHLVIQALEDTHKSLTDLVIQKGTKNVKNPDDPDIRRN